MEKLSAFFAALRHGSSLTDSTIWKQRQNLTNALVGLLGAVSALLVSFGVQINVSQEELVAIVGGITTIVGVFNNYLTTATTDKLGLPSAPEANNGFERGA